MRYKGTATLLAALLILLAGCSGTQAPQNPQEAPQDVLTADHSGWQEEPYYILQFNMDSVISNAPAVTASSSRVTLSQGGTYLLSGSLQNAQLIIDVPAGETARLVLRSVNMHCERGPAILSQGAGTVVVLLEEGTESTLTDGENYLYTSGAGQDAVVWTAGDLLITGGGSLTVTASHADAVCSRGRLAVAGGNIAVTAWRDGLIGEQSLVIRDGRLTLTCGGVGLSAPAAGSGGGNITLSDGRVDMTAGGDGITAAGVLSVTGGEYRIRTGGGSANRSYGETAESWGVWGGLPQEEPEGETAAEEAAALPRREPPVCATARGLAAGRQLVLTGGSITLDCSDDALYSQGSTALAGSRITLSGGDDALYCAGTAALSGGEVSVRSARRGLLAADLTVMDGALTLHTAEKGICLGGGRQTAEQSGTVGETGDMTVTGGSITVLSGGDALDLAGALSQSGGELLLGPGRESCPLLCASAQVSGGTLLALGDLPQEIRSALPRLAAEMWLTARLSFTVTAFGQSAPLISFTPENPYSAVLLLSDELQQQEEYILASGNARILAPAVCP